MNRKDITRHKKRKKNKLKLLFWGILFAFVAVLVMYLFSLGGKSIGEILSYKNYWLSVGVANGLILIGFLMMYRVDAQNIALNENDLEDTEWLSVKRLKKLKEFQVYDYKSAEQKTDGIVIGAEKKGGSVEVITTSQLHALIVGTTGSGKTTGFVDQNIAVLGKSRGKPSIVISDPKKELYEKHARTLEKEGYKISVLDLREPYSSERWNPMNVLLRRIRLVKDLENNLQQKDGKYYGAGEVFLSYRDARTRMQELKDEIYENAQDLVYTLCPVQNRDQPTWEQGARNLIFGFVLAMCEDCIKGKIDESQLVLFNVYHNITKYCSEDTTALRNYLIEGRDEFSKVRGLVNTVLITSDKTLTSYLSEVNSYMQQLSDDGKRDDDLKKEISTLNITFFCLHGNKENRPQNVGTYGIRSFCGGKVYYEPKYPNIYFAIDGEIYTFEGKKYMVVGGAHSVDKMRCLEEGTPFWYDEMPDDTVKAFVEQRLHNEGNKIYGMMTHTCPIDYLPTEMFISTRQNSDIKRKPRKANSKKLFKPDIDRSTEIWLGELEKKLDYNVWFCGHYHIDKKIDKIRMMYNDICPLHMQLGAMNKYHS